MLKKIINYISQVEERYIEFIIILLWAILLYNNILLYERIKIFFILLVIILGYVSLLKLCISYIEIWKYNKWEKVEKEKMEKLYYKEIEVLTRKLVRIYNYKNPVIFLLWKIEIKLYYFFRWINYKLMNYLWIRNSMYVIIMSIFIMPIHIVLFYYYRSWKNFKERTLVDLLFKRAEGLIIGVIFTSKISSIIIYYIKGVHILMCIYFLLIIISMIILLVDNEKREEYNYKFLLSEIITLRLEVTILGVIIEEISSSFRGIKAMVKNINIKAEEKFFCLPFTCLSDDRKGSDLLIKRKNILYSIMFKEYMEKEIKNKPSYMFYHFFKSMLYLYNDEIIDMEYYLLIETQKENRIRFLKENLEYQRKLSKELIFLLWDIEDYIMWKGVNHLYIDEYAYIQSYSKAVNIKNFKVEKNKNEGSYLDMKENYELILDYYEKYDYWNNEKLRKYKNEKENVMGSWMNFKKILKNWEEVQKKQIEFLVEAIKEWRKLRGKKELEIKVVMNEWESDDYSGIKLKLQEDCIIIVVLKLNDEFLIK